MAFSIPIYLLHFILPSTYFYFSSDAVIFYTSGRDDAHFALYLRRSRIKKELSAFLFRLLTSNFRLRSHDAPTDRWPQTPAAMMHCRLPAAFRPTQKALPLSAGLFLFQSSSQSQWA